MTNKGVAPWAALVGATYRKSSRSTTADNCMEVADLPSGHRTIQDSKDAAGPILTFGPSEWAAFTAGIRAGDFS